MDSQKIVLAEDDGFIGRAYKDGLERAGFEVVLVADGDEVFKTVLAEKPGLLLLDLIMPGLNGFAVLEKLQAEGVLETMKVLVVSNLGQMSDVEKAQSFGVVGYVVKSDTSMSQLVEKVKDVMGVSD